MGLTIPRVTTKRTAHRSRHTNAPLAGRFVYVANRDSPGASAALAAQPQSTVIPAQAGIQERHGSMVATEQVVLFRDNRTLPPLDSGLRRNDGEECGGVYARHGTGSQFTGSAEPAKSSWK